ncbi:PfkB family carbohydrate kinase [Nocardia tengchongensis]|uniref:PfkB family carbohydrate kinase n=1 Tax=Nocardia tengchongensis TaxID=2055889 RepID=UPI00364DD072
MSSAWFVGLTTVDIAYGVDSYPPEDSKTLARNQFLGAGGPAANAAVAYAILSGDSPTLVTALGRDRLAEIARRDLLDNGVMLVDTTADSDHQPPVSSIVVARESQTRTIVSLDGSRISAPFKDDLAAGLKGANIVLIDAHHPELSAGIAAAANESDIPVVLDAGRWKDAHKALLPLVDIAILSTAFEPPDLPTATADNVIDYVRSVGPQKVAITHGAGPIRYSDDSSSGEIAVQPVDAIDTLGAGDILHGAFCHFTVQGHDFIESLSHAAEMATLSCQHFGTRRWSDFLTPGRQ